MMAMKRTLQNQPETKRATQTNIEANGALRVQAVIPSIKCDELFNVRTQNTRVFSRIQYVYFPFKLCLFCYVCIMLLHDFVFYILSQQF